jgi:hypothetical protein
MSQKLEVIADAQDFGDPFPEQIIVNLALTNL